MARVKKNTTERRPEDWFPPARPINGASVNDIDDAFAARDINTTAPITGGGNLSADLTLVLSGTKVQFNGALSDGDFLFVGDISSYTDEMAQDAVGNILTDSASIDFTYDDGAGTITAIVKAGSIGPTELAATAVTPGSYTSADITVDADGRITAAANGAGGGGYTDEQAQDAIGGILTDSITIDFTYDDATPSITASCKPAAAMAKRTTNQTTADYSAGVAIPWDGEVYDTNSLHDTVTNNSRMTVPSGVSYVEVGCTASLSSVTAEVVITLEIRKGGTASYDGVPRLKQNTNSTTPILSVSSGPLPVVAGDYFEAYMTMSDTSITVLADGSNFWMRIIA